MEGKQVIGIIGGTGISAELLENAKEQKVETPYGAPSDSIFTGSIAGKKVAFVPRHGRKHTINPSNVNYRANVFALKKIGVRRIIAPCAVGSLRKEITPGSFVFPDQFIDFTKSRKNTFFDAEVVAHASMSKPFCSETRAIMIGVAKRLGIECHEKGTNIVVEGPRFSSVPESRMFRQWGADTINMTMMPEAGLAREAELCYCPVAMVTDYDNFSEHRVDLAEVLGTMRANAENFRKLVAEAVKEIPEERKCGCGSAMQGAKI
ncbi:MAG: S-methyl-5'-thioadenosine phosphorylase [archaeon]